MRREKEIQNTSSLWKKARYNAKTCYKLIAEDGREVQGPDAILEEERDYYAKLYAVDEDVEFTLVNSFGVKVPDKVKEVQEQQLTIKDLEQAIKLMSNNKTPGEDGIPIDFYKVFWRLLKDIFYEMMLEIFLRGKMHSSSRRGILNLIPKPGKDSRFIKNLRPITLS